MNRTLRIVLSIILFMLVAAGAYFWSTGMIDSMYTFRSSLKDNPPAPAPSTFEPASRRVVFVLIDGLRLDTSLDSEVMPNLNQLRQQGAFASMHSQAPSFSQPGYSTLLTGAWPYLNDGPALNLDFEDIPTFNQDDLFSAVTRSGKKTAISAFNWFEKLIPQSAVAASFYTPGDDHLADRAVVNAALPMLKGPSFALVLIHLDQVDYAGHHEGGARSPNWTAAAERADDLLAEVLSQLDLRQDTVLVVSDHGHIDQGGHGGPDPVVLIEPFVLAGAAVKPGKYSDVAMVDVAPTVAALLGASLPASTQGTVRADMLILPASTQNAMHATTRVQQSALVKAYTSAIGQPVEPADLTAAATVDQFQNLINKAITARLTSERTPRALLALIMVAGMVFVLARQDRRKAAWWLVGGLLGLVLFHIRFALLDGKPYSLSGVTSQMDLILYIAITTLIATFTGWLVMAIGVFRAGKGSGGTVELSLGYFFTTMALLLLPILVHFVLNGVLVGWMLPEMVSGFIALITLIQLLITAVLGVLLVGISVLWDWRRKGSVK